MSTKCMCRFQLQRRTVPSLYCPTIARYITSYILGLGLASFLQTRVLLKQILTRITISMPYYIESDIA